MNTEKKAKIAIFVGFAIVVIVGCLFGITSSMQNAEAEEVTELPIPAEEVTETTLETDYEFPTMPWQEAGYSDLKTYWEDLTSKRASFEGISAQMQEELAGYLSEEDITKLDELESKLVKSSSIQQLNEYEAQLNEIVNAAKEVRDAEIAAQQTAYSSSGNGGAYYSNGSGLTKQSGVNYYNGRKETYYSSRVLYHYRTPEWVLGSDGVYRTQDGYVVVAASDLPQGSYVETSFGMGQVLDSGCAANVTDIYTAW